MWCGASVRPHRPADITNWRRGCYPEFRRRRRSSFHQARPPSPGRDGCACSKTSRSPLERLSYRRPAAEPSFCTASDLKDNEFSTPCHRHHHRTPQTTRPRIRVREPPPFRRLRLLQPPLQLEQQRSNKPMPSSHSHRTSTTQLFKPWLDTFPLLATYASSDIASVTVVNCTVSRYRSLLLRFANWLRHATLPRKRIQICATSSSPGSHARAYGSGYCSRVTRSRLTAPWR